MEIDLIENKIEENQISFDFLNTPETLTKVENFDWVAEETLVIILRSDEEVSSDFEICGKKMIDWVALACSGCKQKIINDPKEENLFEEIKKYAENFNFVVVLYSDTPLLQKQTFLEIMDYFSKHKMNVLKLLRGFVFRGEYLKNARMMFSTAVEEFNKEEFVQINSAMMISHAFKVLNSRILEYHKQRGVIFFGENTIFIDADVEIESGAVIYPNNILKGESYIGKNVILESGNYIIDTIVCDEAFVTFSYLEKSKISEGKIVGPYSKLIGQKL